MKICPSAVNLLYFHNLLFHSVDSSLIIFCIHLVTYFFFFWFYPNLEFQCWKCGLQILIWYRFHFLLNFVKIWHNFLGLLYAYLLIFFLLYNMFISSWSTICDRFCDFFFIFFNSDFDAEKSELKIKFSTSFNFFLSILKFYIFLLTTEWHFFKVFTNEIIEYIEVFSCNAFILC